MAGDAALEMDAVIFGGGAAGLWTLDLARRRGLRAVLLEADHLGAGQTVASQGILHGGVKYALSGMLTASARAIRDMPQLWRRALAGEIKPDLSAVRVRSQYCHLWRTGSLRSRLGMLGARVGLRTNTEAVESFARPPALRDVPGDVARVDEQVIDPASLLESLSRAHRGAVLRIDARSGLEFGPADADGAPVVRLIDPETGAPLDLHPRRLVLLAGAGNAGLRAALGLPTERMQRRPLHMVLLRGDLPELNGHCVDGMRTRATITTVRDVAGRTIWQVGGHVAEAGVEMEPEALVAHAAVELAAILPGLDLADAEWATYRVDRAEARSATGARPEGVGLLEDGPVLTGWPTKLVLVPVLAEEIVARLPAPRTPPTPPDPRLVHWPRPETALPPWEEDRAWIVARSDAPA